MTKYDDLTPIQHLLLSIKLADHLGDVANAVQSYIRDTGGEQEYQDDAGHWRYPWEPEEDEY